jgi:hypothetical protein
MTEGVEQRILWTRIALWLVVATMGYNVLEAVVALWSGVEAESVALFGFGLDSVIETAAGWWWADPVAALLMVPWLVKEGREGLRGEGCCG